MLVEEDRVRTLRHDITKDQNADKKHEDNAKKVGEWRLFLACGIRLHSQGAHDPAPLRASALASGVAREIGMWAGSRSRPVPFITSVVRYAQRGVQNRPVADFIHQNIRAKVQYGFG